MKLLNTYTIIVKKSKFIAYYFEVNNVDEIKQIIISLKKTHKKANHFPYAYNILNISKKSDDGEPSGTAGMPILKIIAENNLSNSLIVVVRYFGGIKLGSGGLLRSYMDAAKEVIKKS